MLAGGSRINTVSSDDLMPKASVGTFAAGTSMAIK
jgi:hypothetical protein